MRKLVLILALSLGAVVVWIAKAWSGDKPLGDEISSLRESRQVEKDIVEREAKVAEQQKQLLAALEGAVENYDPKQFETIDSVVQNMRPAVRQLHTVATQLINHQDGYAADLLSLREAVDRAPDVYRNASKVFKDYAEHEAFAEIKDDYKNLSEIWRLMAEEIERRGEAVKAEEKQLADFKKYLEHTNRFLERLDQHLASLPQTTSDAERALHVAHMRRYVEGFESLRKSLHAFHDKLAAVPAANAGGNHAGQTVDATKLAVVPATSSVPAAPPSQTPPPAVVQVTPVQPVPVTNASPATAGATVGR